MTATSGLAVAITTTGGCSGSGSGAATITMTSGTTACVVHYNQAGNANYNAALEATNTTSASPATLRLADDGADLHAGLPRIVIGQRVPRRKRRESGRGR